MNIYDISQKAGVSIATVSRVMNCNPNVSEKTRNKVLEIMKDCGYTPNVFARGLGLNSMKMIGLMCADSSHPFLANAVYYLEQNLHKNGYDSFLCCTGYDIRIKQNYLKLLLSKRVDAIIMVGSTFLEPLEEANQYIFDAAKKVPIMLINGYLNHPNIYCTICKDKQAVYHAVTCLIRHGRRRILYLYNANSYSGKQKLLGYQEAITSYHQCLDPLLIQESPNNIEDTKNLLSDLTAKGISFDAVMAAEDLLAIGAIKYLKQQNIQIPKECSVIGYNNSLLATCCDPELTSVDNHVESLCTNTISTLMRVLSHESVPNRIMLSNDLVTRQTTDF